MPDAIRVRTLSKMTHSWAKKCTNLEPNYHVLTTAYLFKDWAKNAKMQRLSRITVKEGKPSSKKA